MSGSIPPRVAVVLASIDAARTIQASVSGFLAEVGDRGEVIVVDASRDGSADRARAISPRIRVLQREPGSLAPELWRDGLDSCDADRVAFSTCQMVPRSGWLSAMLATLDASGAAGVGGPIAPAPRLRATDRALYLLRFASYLPPLPDSDRFDPPGDNAVYRRDRLEGLDDSWKDGFWELDVHRRMRLRGDRLATSPRAVVEFAGGARFGPAIGHRMAHARHFGAGRSRSLGLAGRVLRSAASPAVPPLLMARIARTLRDRGEPIGPWISSAPRLAMLLSAWSVGEAAGALFGPGGRPQSV